MTQVRLPLLCACALAAACQNPETLLDVGPAPIDGAIAMDAPSTDSGPTTQDAGPPEMDVGSRVDAVGSGVTAAIDFPPPSSTIAASLPFRGTASSTSAIISVRVNGIDVDTTDDYATWTLSVPMDIGANVASVEVETAGGTVEAAAVEIIRHEAGPELSRGTSTRYGEIGHHVFPGVTALAYDHEHDRVFASDSYGKGVWYVELATGDQFDLTRGVEGVPFNHPRDLVYAPTNQHVYVVLKDAPKYVLDINTVDRTRRILPGVEGAEDVDWNHTTNELIISSLTNNTLTAFDPQTDTVRVISSNTVGGGIEQSQYTPLQVAVDESTNRAFITGLAYRHLLAVDLTSGERTIASDEEGNFGTSDLTQWAAQRETYAQGYNSTIPLDDEPIYAVNLDTGARRRVPMGDDGLTMVMARGIAAYPHGILYASIWGIFSVDPVTGTRVMVSGRAVGESDDGRECLPDCTAP